MKNKKTIIIIVSVLAAGLLLFFILGMLRNGPRPPMEGQDPQQPAPVTENQ